MKTVTLPLEKKKTKERRGISDRLYRYFRGCDQFGNTGCYFGKYNQFINAIRVLAGESTDKIIGGFMAASAVVFVACMLIPSIITALPVSLLLAFVLMTSAKQVMEDMHEQRISGVVDAAGKGNGDKVDEVREAYDKTWKLSVGVAAAILAIQGVSLVFARNAFEVMLQDTDSTAMAAVLVLSALFDLVMVTITTILTYAIVKWLFNNVIQRVNSLLHGQIRVYGKVKIKDDVSEIDLDDECDLITFEGDKFVFYGIDFIGGNYGPGEQCYRWKKLTSVDLSLNPVITIKNWRAEGVKVLDSRNYMNYL